MWVQFEGGNKTRAGTINIATLPCSYAHCVPSRFSPNELHLIVTNRPNTAALYSCAIIDNDSNKVLLYVEALLVQSNN